MNWEQLKGEVRNLLLSRNLSDPNIRLNALRNLDDLFLKRFPEIIKNPSLLLNHNKNDLKDELAKLKSNKKLNSAESSVINNLYQILSTGNTLTQVEAQSNKQVRTNDIKNNDINEDKKADILMQEYASITQQIVHWDTFFWTKSRFFLGAEGVALLASINIILPHLNGEKSLSLSLFWVLLGMVLLNCFLCYVWFLTGRRNRDFLSFRFERGLEIENHPVLQVEQQGQRTPLVRLYQHQEDQLNSQPLKDKSSHYWEIKIPIVFAISWLALLIAGVLLLKDDRWLGLTGSVLVFALGWLSVRLYNRSEKRKTPPETIGHV